MEMRFPEFQHLFQDHPVLLSRHLVRHFKSPQIMRNQMTRWQKRALLTKLRKGMYTWGFTPGGFPPVDPRIIAGRLYEPSYLSLEYALQFHGLIPEQVVTLTSVTTRKTMRFENPVGRFIYRHIGPAAFRGFFRLEESGHSFYMAQAEKAVVDYLYLNLDQIPESPRDFLSESLRFQNIEDLDPLLLVKWSRLFENKKLSRVIEQLGQWVLEEHNG